MPRHGQSTLGSAKGKMSSGQGRGLKVSKTKTGSKHIEAETSKSSEINRNQWKSLVTFDHNPCCSSRLSQLLGWVCMNVVGGTLAEKTCLPLHLQESMRKLPRAGSFGLCWSFTRSVRVPSYVLAYFPVSGFLFDWETILHLGGL